jgi:hypothetical protein
MDGGNVPLSLTLNRNATQNRGTSALLAVRFAEAQVHRVTEQYTPSDLVLVGRTGRPQLVEFFHHL